MRLINKEMCLNIEMFITELFEDVGIDTSDKLNKMIDELEDCVETAIYDYAEDNNIDL